MARAGLGAHCLRPAADQLPHDARLDLAAHPGRHGARRRARQQDRAHEPHRHRRDRARLQQRARTCASVHAASTRTCARPSTYMNRTRTGTTPVPADRRPARARRRRRVGIASRARTPRSGTTTASTGWERRRPTSCATTPERSHTIDPQWTVAFRYGAQTVAVHGSLDWVPGPSGWPWVAFVGALFALGVAGRARGGAGRGDRRGRRARRRRPRAHDQRGGRARGHAAGEDGAVLRRQLRVGDRVGRGRAHDLGARPAGASRRCTACSSWA